MLTKPDTMGIVSEAEEHGIGAELRSARELIEDLLIRRLTNSKTDLLIGTDSWLRSCGRQLRLRGSLWRPCKLTTLLHINQGGREK